MCSFIETNSIFSLFLCSQLFRLDDKKYKMQALLVAFIVMGFIQNIQADKLLSFVGQNGVNMTFNVDLTLFSNETYCINLPVTRVEGIETGVTVDMISTNPDHKLSDIQIMFFPNRQYIGGVPGFSVFGGDIMANFPNTWDKYNTDCRSQSFSTPRLNEPFEQLCIANTCVRGKSQTYNTFKGQVTVTGFQTNQYLTSNPPPATCGSSQVGEIQYIAKGTDPDAFLGFNFQVIAGEGNAICHTVEKPIKAIKDLAHNVHVELSYSNGAPVEDLVVYFQYPDGSVKSIGNSGATYGDRIGSWPAYWTGVTAPDTETCYLADTDSEALTSGFTQVCVANGCTSGCDQRVYTGRVTLNGYHTKSNPEWLGNIQTVCPSEVIYQPTYSPTQTPPVTRGQIGAIILVTVFGLFATILALWFTVVGFRSTYSSFFFYSSILFY